MPWVPRTRYTSAGGISSQAPAVLSDLAEARPPMARQCLRRRICFQTQAPFCHPSGTSGELPLSLAPIKACVVELRSMPSCRRHIVSHAAHQGRKRPTHLSSAGSCRLETSTARDRATAASSIEGSIVDGALPLCPTESSKACSVPTFKRSQSRFGAHIGPQASTRSPHLLSCAVYAVLWQYKS